ncbi:hypothetical protein Tco_0332180 [Tanacetum coccineum]
MELHDVSYGNEYIARPLLLIFSSEILLLWFRYRECDLAHLKLVSEFSIYNVWMSVQYGVSNRLDTMYWGFIGERIRRIFLMDTGYWHTDTPYLLDGYWRIWSSDNSYDDLKKAFQENYLQQKKCIKDPIEIHNIKQREGESTEDFVKRYKLESRDVKGAP